MSKTLWQRLGRLLPTFAVAALATACTGELPAGPDSDMAALAAGRVKQAETEVCANLAPPEGNRVFRRLYANGAQVYVWNGTSWTFVEPDAVLSADPKGRSTVGAHYAGPTWESNDGSTSVGTVVDRCSPNPDAISWLLLSTVSQGPGAFRKVTFIQRLNTEGGLAPTEPGTVAGQEARVPYAAVYVFYRGS